MMRRGTSPEARVGKRKSLGFDIEANQVMNNDEIDSRMSMRTPVRQEDLQQYQRKSIADDSKNTGGRKGTAASCEIALIECLSESANLTERFKELLINTVRLELLQATDPELYAERQQKEGYQLLLEDMAKDREDIMEDDVDQEIKDDFESEHFDTQEDELKDKIPEQTMQNNHQIKKGRTLIFERPRSRQLSMSSQEHSNKKGRDLRINIEDGENTSPQDRVGELSARPLFNAFNGQKNNQQLISAKSCDKQEGFGFFHNPMIQSMNSKDASMNSNSGTNHTKTADNSPEREGVHYIKGRSVFNKVSTGNNVGLSKFGPQMLQHNNSLGKRISDTQSRYEAMSPISSNVSSFYYDRLEEFLPEKRMIADKKLQRQKCLIFKNEDEEGAGSGTHQFGHGESFSPRSIILPTTPMQQFTSYVGKQIGNWGYNRGGVGNTSTFSQIRSQMMWRKRADGSKVELTFQQKKQQLKESLTKFKDIKAEKNENERRSTAQALKYLRKLGRKLKKPILQRVPRNKTLQGLQQTPIHGSSTVPAAAEFGNKFQTSTTSIPFYSDPTPYGDVSPGGKSMITNNNDEYSGTKISPRQSIFQHQMLHLQKQNSQNDPNSNPLMNSIGFKTASKGGQQFCFTLTVANEEDDQDQASSAGFRHSFEDSKFNLEKNYSANFPGAVSNPQNDSTQVNPFADMIKSFQEEKEANKHKKLPKFNKNALFSFEDIDTTMLFNASNAMNLQKQLPTIEQEASESPDVKKESPIKPLMPTESAITVNNLNPSTILSNNGSGGSANHFYDMGRQVSFSSDAIMQAYNEIQQLQSPMLNRNQIKAEDLDETEQFVLEALDEYRKVDFIKDFKNYKNYYDDAKNQNSEILQQAKPQAQNLGNDLASISFNKSGNNSHQTMQATSFDDLQPRDRFVAVSFKDPRMFLPPDRQWQQDVHTLLMSDDGHSVLPSISNISNIRSSEEEKKNLDDFLDNQLLDRQDRVDEVPETEEDDTKVNQDLLMEKQVSNQDLNPWIDQSQPVFEPMHQRESSLQKSERKSNLSQASYKKISSNLKKLSQMLEVNDTSSKRRASRQTNATGRVMSHQEHTTKSHLDNNEDKNEGQQQCMKEWWSNERGQNRISNSGSGRSSLSPDNISPPQIKLHSANNEEQKHQTFRKKNNRTGTILTSPKNLNYKTYGDKSMVLENSIKLFVDNKALKRISNNLRNLYNDLQKSPSPDRTSLLNKTNNSLLQGRISLSSIGKQPYRGLLTSYSPYNKQDSSQSPEELLCEYDPSPENNKSKPTPTKRYTWQIPVQDVDQQIRTFYRQESHNVPAIHKQQIETQNEQLQASFKAAYHSHANNTKRQQQPKQKQNNNSTQNTPVQVSNQQSIRNNTQLMANYYDQQQRRQQQY